MPRREWRRWKPESIEFPHDADLDMKRFRWQGYGEMIGNAAGIPFGRINGSGIARARVRRALAMAVDRRCLRQSVLRADRPVLSAAVEGMAGIWAGTEKLYKPDPKAAMALLEEADGSRDRTGYA